MLTAMTRRHDGHAWVIATPDAFFLGAAKGTAMMPMPGVIAAPDAAFSLDVLQREQP